MNRRQRKELDLIIEDSRKMLDMCMKILLEEQAPKPCNPKIDKVFEYLLKQNIEIYAEKDKAWFDSDKLLFNPARLHSRKDDLFDCCRANNYLTLDEIHKAAVSLWPEKYSFIIETNEIKNEVPCLAGSSK